MSQERVTELETENETLRVELAALQEKYHALMKKHKKTSKIMFNNIATMNPKKNKKGGIGAITMKMKDMRLQETRVLLSEVAEWLNRTMNCVIEPNGSDLFDELGTGVVLCDLVRKIKPDLKMGNVHRNAANGSFIAHDNINMFVFGAKELGMRGTFEPSDLVSGARIVLLCLLNLAHVAELNHGFLPAPRIVQMEKEIDENKAGSIVSLTEDEERRIEKEMKDYCEEKGLKPVEKVDKGIYLFGEDTKAHVRVLQDTVLIRHNKEWFEVSQFIDEKHKLELESVTKAPAMAVVDEEAEEEERLRAKEEADQKRRDQQMEAYKEFFYLTALSVKLTSEFREELLTISNDDLFDMARLQGVDFYNFSSWIRNELLKSHIVNLSEQHQVQSEKSGGEANLRQQRASVLVSLSNRRQRQQEAKKKADKDAEELHQVIAE